MARATGIGGVFHRAADPQGLAAWYQQHLGLPVDDQGFMVFGWGERTASPAGTTTVHFFPDDDAYFKDSASRAMVNFRVDDLDGMLDQLRAAGAPVDDHIEEHEFGRFGWATDPEGNRIELWEPGPGH